MSADNVGVSQEPTLSAMMSGRHYLPVCLGRDMQSTPSPTQDNNKKTKFKEKWHKIEHEDFIGIYLLL